MSHPSAARPTAAPCPPHRQPQCIVWIDDICSEPTGQIWGGGTSRSLLDQKETSETRVNTEHHTLAVEQRPTSEPVHHTDPAIPLQGGRALDNLRPNPCSLFVHCCFFLFEVWLLLLRLEGGGVLGRTVLTSMAAGGTTTHTPTTISVFQTGGPRARCGSPCHLMWPARTLKVWTC